MLGDSEKITMNLEKHEAYVLIITGTYSATQLLDNASELSMGSIEILVYSCQHSNYLVEI